MGDLDGRLLRGRLAIEGQQPTTAEGLEHGGQGDGIEVEARQVRQRQPSTGLGRADAELDEMQEHLHRHPLLVSLEPVVDRLCAARQDAPDPAERAVPVQRQRGLRSLVEELGEGEFQEWQRSRPIGCIGDQLCQERGLDGDARLAQRGRRRPPRARSRSSGARSRRPG